MITSDIPDGVIQYGTEIVDGISGLKAKLRRDLSAQLSFDPHDDVACCINFVLYANITRVTVKKRGYSFIELSDVLFRPL
jgi:hypothetical protein